MIDKGDPFSGGKDLTGRMLIAMPGMGDTRFAQSVVFMCDHSDEGAMGLIINKPNGDVDIVALLDQLDISGTTDVSGRPVYFGGPVEVGRGFVLHSADHVSPVATLSVCDDIHMTGTLDILEDIVSGKGPSRWALMLGYAGWGAGQLEQEIAANGWLVCEASARLVFDLPDAEKWEASLESIGVAALVLSSEGGRA